MTEGTQKPTDRKLKKARAKGDVPQSKELASSLIFLGALLLLWGLGENMMKGLQHSFSMTNAFLHIDSPLECLKAVFLPIVYPLLLFFLGIFCLALLAHVFQTGWMWSWSKPKQEEKGSWIFVLLKVILIAAIGYWVLFKEKPDLTYCVLGPESKTSLIYEKIFSMLLKIAFGMVCVGIADFFFQKHQYAKRMRMTPQEIKDEKKETGS